MAKNAAFVAIRTKFSAAEAPKVPLKDKTRYMVAVFVQTELVGGKSTVITFRIDVVL